MKKTFALILACCLLTGCGFNSGELDFGESSSYISSENSGDSGASSSKSDNSRGASVSSGISDEPESTPASSESSSSKPQSSSTPASSESSSSKPESTPASSESSSSKPESTPASSESSSSKPESTPASSESSSSKPQSSSTPALSSSTESEPQVIEVIGSYGQRAPEAWEIEFADEVFRLTNIERVKNGLPEFKRLQPLENVAYMRAWELFFCFEHARPDGGDWVTAFDEAGIGYSYAAENIAAGYGTPQEVVDGWMNSPGHRANILNPELEYLGTGFYCDSEGIGAANYKYYWSQNFCALW